MEFVEKVTAILTEFGSPSDRVPTRFGAITFRAWCELEIERYKEHKDPLRSQLPYRIISDESGTKIAIAVVMRKPVRPAPASAATS